MKTRLVIDDDSVYEIDEECDRARREKALRKEQRKEHKKAPLSFQTETGSGRIQKREDQ